VWYGTLSRVNIYETLKTVRNFWSILYVYVCMHISVCLHFVTDGSLWCCNMPGLRGSSYVPEKKQFTFIY